jgi:hypothetical protein
MSKGPAGFDPDGRKNGEIAPGAGGGDFGGFGIPKL